MTEEEHISALKILIGEQKKLLSISLEVAFGNQLKFNNTIVKCKVSQNKIKTGIMNAMDGGTSVNTILKISDWRGIPVRDLFPIARASLEAFINASYLIAEDEWASKRAIKYVEYAHFKQTNRKAGSGEFSFTLSSDTEGIRIDVGNVNEVNTRNERFSEFNGSGNGNWRKIGRAHV